MAPDLILLGQATIDHVVPAQPGAWRAQLGVSRGSARGSGRRPYTVRLPIVAVWTSASPCASLIRPGPTLVTDVAVTRPPRS